MLRYILQQYSWGGKKQIHEEKLNNFSNKGILSFAMISIKYLLINL
jgi:hypothetical protein